MFSPQGSWHHYVFQSLLVYKHITQISSVSKAYHILGLLYRTFLATNSLSTWKSLYISLVRSQLLYCSQI